MQIRPAGVKDAPGIAEVHVASWRWAYADVFPPDVLDGLRHEDRERMWRDVVPHGGVVVAEDGGRIVGFASVGPVADGDGPEGTSELFAIYVAPDVAGTGLGRSLLDRATDTMRMSGARRALLWVLASNVQARRFYDAAGWESDGTTNAYEIGGLEYPIVRYVTNI